MESDSWLREERLPKLLLELFPDLVIDRALVIDHAVECVEDPLQLPPVRDIDPAEPETDAVDVVVLQLPLVVVGPLLRDDVSRAKRPLMLRRFKEHDPVRAVREGVEQVLQLQPGEGGQGDDAYTARVAQPSEAGEVDRRVGNGPLHEGEYLDLGGGGFQEAPYLGLELGVGQALLVQCAMGAGRDAGPAAAAHDLVDDGLLVDEAYGALGADVDALTAAVAEVGVG